MSRTPGPWSVGTDRVGMGLDEIPIYDTNGACVCGCWQMGEDFDGENDDANAIANATLIAAAPDLLEALRCLFTHAERSTLPYQSQIEDARNAIAKAEGRS